MIRQSERKENKPMNTNRKRPGFIITMVAFVLLLCAIAWYQYTDIRNSTRSIKENAARREILNKQYAAACLDAKNAELQLLNAQHSLNTIGSPLDDNSPCWQRVRELLHDPNGQLYSDSAEMVRAEKWKPQRPKPPRPITSGMTGNVFPQLLANPEYAALAKEVWIGDSYENLFRFMRINDLPGTDKLASLQRIWYDAKSAKMDVRGAEASLGSDNITARVAQKMQSDIYTQEKESLIALVGKDAYNRYITYSTFSVDNFNVTEGPIFSTDNLITRLSYSTEPMTESQMKQMFELACDEGAQFQQKRYNLAKTGATGAEMGNDIEDAYKTSKMSDDYNARAAEILTPAQMQGLRELQEEKRVSVDLWNRNNELAR